MNFNSWVTCLKPNPQAKLRLFCFHYAGGRSLSFRTWFDRFPSEIEVCTIELPGRGLRILEPPIDNLEVLIESLVRALLPALDKPFVFFGHSMGALLCYETSQLLQKQHNISPLHLFVSGQRAPHLPSREPPIHHLPKAELIEALRRYNGTPEEVLNNQELMELFLPALRADFLLIETHQVFRHTQPLNCSIDVFGGSKDWTANTEELKAWQEHTELDFAIQMFPGEHFFIHSEEAQFLLVLIEKIKQVACHKGFS